MVGGAAHMFVVNLSLQSTFAVETVLINPHTKHLEKVLWVIVMLVFFPNSAAPFHSTYNDIRY